MRTIDKKEWRLMSQRQRMSPFPNYMSMEAMTGLLKKYVGVNLSGIILFFEDRIMNGFVKTEESQQVAEKIIARIQKQPKLYHQLVTTEDRLGKLLVNFAQKASHMTTGKTANKTLLLYWKQYERLYKEVYAAYGSVWIIENVLNAQLLEIVQKRIADFSKASTMLNALIRQPSAMVARIEREALCKLAAAIQKNESWKVALRGSGQELPQKLVAAIRKHEKNYFWVIRDYEDPILDFEKIVAQLREMMTEDMTKKYQDMVIERKGFYAEQKKYKKELALTKQETILFDAMLAAAHLKELRKRYVSESLYYFDTVLIEIGKRLFMSIKQVRFFSTKEIEAALLHDKDVSETINARIKLSAWHSNKGKIQVLINSDAEPLRKQFLAYSKDTSVFTGMPVSPGKARGPVKIVMNPNEIDKVKKGDIIVSVQVVPSFAPAILRAAGIICDGGHGVTAHPAILAREAGIPCIIQTRFAREVLKDGDMVEVDGYKGTATKV